MPSYEFEAFISHAYEDKKQVADPLQAALDKAGCKTWYSGKDIPAGRHLDEIILKEAIPNSKWCILIISPHFLQSEWTRKEVQQFKKLHGKKNFLPVLHGITAEEVSDEYQFLMKGFALSTDKGIDDVVLKLIKTIRNEKKGGLSAFVIFLTVVLLAVLLFYIKQNEDRKNVKQQLEEQVAKYTEQFEQKLAEEYLAEMTHNRGEPFSRERLLHLYTRLTEGVRIEPESYVFSSGYGPVKGPRNMEKLNLPVNTTIPSFFYELGLEKPVKISCNETTNKKLGELTYAIFDEDTPEYEITDIQTEPGNKAVVTVSYTNPLRCIKVSLSAAKNEPGKALARIWYKGFRPHEQYVFSQRNGYWEFVSLK